MLPTLLEDDFNSEGMILSNSYRELQREHRVCASDYQETGAALFLYLTIYLFPWLGTDATPRNSIIQIVAP